MTKMVSAICVVLVCLLCLLPAGFSAAWPGPNGNTAICSIPGVTVVFSPLSGDMKQYWSEKLRGSLKDFANDAFLHDCVAQGLIPPDADPSVYSCISAAFVSIDGYEEGMGELSATYPVEPKLHQSDGVVGMIAGSKGNETILTPVSAEVDNDGYARITFEENTIQTCEITSGSKLLLLYAG